jgi:hypothetical protein
VRDRVSVRIPVAGAHEAVGALGCHGHAADRLGREGRAVCEHHERGAAGWIERVQPGAQRRRHAALPVLVAHRPRTMQVDRGEHLLAVRAEHDHAVAERRRRERGERPFDERSAGYGGEHLDAPARGLEARARTGREQHAADHPGPRPPPTRSPPRAKRP